MESHFLPSGPIYLQILIHKRDAFFTVDVYVKYFTTVKKSNNSLITRYFGAGRTPCHLRIYRCQPALSHNYGPVPQQKQQIHGCLLQPHYHNIKQLFYHIYSSSLSSSDYSRFPLTWTIFLRWCDCLIILNQSSTCVKNCKVFNTKVDITENTILNICKWNSIWFPIDIVDRLILKLSLD